MDILLFFHLAGIIIGLGAVTVIDSMGFISRKSKPWTKITIHAHHVTKPLIWLGIGIVSVSWIFFLFRNGFTDLSILKTVLLGVLILNGSFLSFYISPLLDRLSHKKSLLPSSLQRKIAMSMMLSFLSWWSFVVITVLSFG